MKNSKILPLVWKKTDNGGETAFCGTIKIGWVKRGFLKQPTYYVTLLNDMIRLKVQEYKTIEEAREALSNTFYEVINLMLIKK